MNITYNSKFINNKYKNSIPILIKNNIILICYAMPTINLDIGLNLRDYILNFECQFAKIIHKVDGFCKTRINQMVISKENRAPNTFHTEEFYF